MFNTTLEIERLHLLHVLRETVIQELVRNNVDYEQFKAVTSMDIGNNLEAAEEVVEFVLEHGNRDSSNDDIPDILYEPVEGVEITYVDPVFPRSIIQVPDQIVGQEIVEYTDMWRSINMVLRSINLRMCDMSSNIEEDDTIEDDLTSYLIRRSMPFATKRHFIRSLYDGFIDGLIYDVISDRLPIHGVAKTLDHIEEYISDVEENSDHVYVHVTNRGSLIDNRQKLSRILKYHREGGSNITFVLSANRVVDPESAAIIHSDVFMTMASDIDRSIHVVYSNHL